MPKYLLRLSWPHKNLSGNSRAHHMAKGRATRLYRQEACFSLYRGGMSQAKGDPGARLNFEFYPPDKRRRDLHNMPHMMKSAIDGIADAMGCDDSEFRVRWPDQFAEPVKGGAVLVTVTTGEE